MAGWQEHAGGDTADDASCGDEGDTVSPRTVEERREDTEFELDMSVFVSSRTVLLMIATSLTCWYEVHGYTFQR